MNDSSGTRAFGQYMRSILRAAHTLSRIDTNVTSRITSRSGELMPARPAVCLCRNPELPAHSSGYRINSRAWNGIRSCPSAYFRRSRYGEGSIV